MHRSALGGGVFPIRIVSIVPGSATESGKPALASTKGGPLPVRQGPLGQLWPDKAVYPVRCEVIGDVRPLAALTGMVNLRGGRRSLAERVLTYAVSVIVRESGI